MGKRLIQQRRGRFNGRYTVPSHRFKGKVKYDHETKKRQGVIEDIVHDPGRTAPLSKVRMKDTNKIILTLAAEGAKVGDIIKFTNTKEDINTLMVGINDFTLQKQYISTIKTCNT